MFVGLRLNELRMVSSIFKHYLSLLEAYSYFPVAIKFKNSIEWLVIGLKHSFDSLLIYLQLKFIIMLYPS